MSAARRNSKSLTASVAALTIIAPLALIFGLASGEDRQDTGNTLVTDPVAECDGVVEVRRGIFRDTTVDVHVCENGVAQLGKPFRGEEVTKTVRVDLNKGNYDLVATFDTHRDLPVNFKGKTADNNDAQTVADIARNGELRATPSI